MPPPGPIIVPREPADLTPAVLTSMLSTTLPEGVRIVVVDVKVLREGGNTGAVLTRCTLTYDGATNEMLQTLPQTLVCKMMDTSALISPANRDTPFERAIVYSVGYTDVNMLHLESTFYNEYARTLVQYGVISPKCYFSRVSGQSTFSSGFNFVMFKTPEQVHGAILLEDLSAGRIFDAVSDAPNEIIRRILFVAARLHGYSATMIETKRDRLPHGGRHFPGAVNYDVQCMMKGLAHVVKQTTPKPGLIRRARRKWSDDDLTILKTDPEVYAACLSFERACDNKVLPRVKERHPFRCFIHGDLHAGNFSFMPPDNSPRIFDWQMWGMGPIAWELAYFFSSNVPVGDARRDEEWLRVYHEELIKIIDKVPGLSYPWNVFRRDVDVALCELALSLLLRRGRFESPRTIRKMAKKSNEAYIMGLERLKKARDFRVLIRLKDLWKRDPMWQFKV